MIWVRGHYLHLLLSYTCSHTHIASRCMRRHMISSWEPWRHPSWRRESWAMMWSDRCSSRLHSTILGRRSSGTISTRSGILVPTLLPLFYFLSSSFCLVVDIRIVFLLVIILSWNLGYCWAIDGYDHHFCIFVDICVFCVGDDSQLPMRTLWDLGVGWGHLPFCSYVCKNLSFLCKFFQFFSFLYNFSFPFEFRGVLYYFDQPWYPVPWLLARI